eukprot:COSAG01_NODE_3444_length_6087_cov_8.153140_1_plen_78_part_00
MQYAVHNRVGNERTRLFSVHHLYSVPTVLTRKQPALGTLGRLINLLGYKPRIPFASLRMSPTGGVFWMVEPASKPIC